MSLPVVYRAAVADLSHSKTGYVEERCSNSVWHCVFRGRGTFSQTKYGVARSGPT